MSSLEHIVSQNDKETKSTNVNEKDKSILFNLNVGNMVQVTSRTWPGINKPGGAARVMRLHYGDDDNQILIAVDVHYLVEGRKEKRVPIEFVAHAPELEEAIVTPKVLKDSLNMEQQRRRQLRDRGLIQGRCTRCGSLRADCNSCDFSPLDSLQSDQIDPNKPLIVLRKRKKQKRGKQIFTIQEHESQGLRSQSLLKSQNSRPESNDYLDAQDSTTTGSEDESSDDSFFEKLKAKRQQLGNLSFHKTRIEDSESSSSDTDQVLTHLRYRLLQQKAKELEKNNEVTDLGYLDKISLSNVPKTGKFDNLRNNAFISRNNNSKTEVFDLKSVENRQLNIGENDIHTARMEQIDSNIVDSGVIEVSSSALELLQGDSNMAHEQDDGYARGEYNTDSSSLLTQSELQPNFETQSDKDLDEILPSKRQSPGISTKNLSSEVYHDSEEDLNIIRRREKRSRRILPNQGNDKEQEESPVYLLPKDADGFIQPEGENVLDGLPQDTIDRSLDIPFSQLQNLFVELETNLQEQILRAKKDFKILQHECNRLNRGIEGDAIELHAKGEQYLQKWRHFLVRDGIDQCRACLRRLNDQQASKLHRLQLSKHERRRWQMSVEALDFRFNNLDEIVQGVMQQARKLLQDLSKITDSQDINYSTEKFDDHSSATEEESVSATRKIEVGVSQDSSDCDVSVGSHRSSDPMGETDEYDERPVHSARIVNRIGKYTKFRKHSKGPTAGYLGHSTRKIGTTGRKLSSRSFKKRALDPRRGHGNDRHFCRPDHQGNSSEDDHQESEVLEYGFTENDVDLMENIHRNSARSFIDVGKRNVPFHRHGISNNQKDRTRVVNGDIRQFTMIRPSRPSIDELFRRVMSSNENKENFSSEVQAKESAPNIIADGARQSKISSERFSSLLENGKLSLESLSLSSDVHEFFKTSFSILKEVPSMVELLHCGDHHLDNYLDLITMVFETLARRKNELDLSSQKQESVVYQILSFPNKLAEAIMLQLVDLFYSQYLSQAWGDPPHLHSTTWSKLQRIVDVLAYSFPLVELVSLILVKQMKCEEIRQPVHAEVGGDGNQFISSCDSAFVMNFFKTGNPQVIKGTKRLAKFKGFIPNDELEVLWALLAFFSRHGESTSQTAMRWQLLDVMLHSKSTALSATLNVLLLEERSSASHAEINQCLVYLNRFNTLLSSGGMLPIPLSSGAITKLLRSSATLSASLLSHEDSFRFMKLSVDYDDIRHAYVLWKRSDLNYQNLPKEDKIENWCRDLLIEMLGPNQGYENKKFILDFGPALSLAPCSRAIHAVCSIIQKWTLAASNEGENRFNLLVDDLAIFSTESTQNSHKLHSSCRRNHNKQKSISNEREVNFVSSFPSDKEGNSGSKFLPGAFAWREAACYTLIAVSATVRESASVSFLDSMAKKAWNCSADAWLKQTQSCILSCEGTSATGCCTLTICELDLCTKTSMSFAFMLFGRLDAQDDTSLTFLVSCAITSIAALSHSLQRSLEENEVSSKLTKKIVEDSDPFFLPSQKHYCLALIRSCSLLSLFMNAVTQSYTCEKTQISPHKNFFSAIRHLGRRIVLMLSVPLQKAISVILASDNLAEIGDICLRLCLSLIRCSSKLAYEVITQECLHQSNIQENSDSLETGNDEFGDLDDDAFLEIDVDKIVAESGVGLRSVYAENGSVLPLSPKDDSTLCIHKDEKALEIRSSDTAREILWPALVSCLDHSRPSVRFEVVQAANCKPTTSGKSILQRQSGAICEVLASLCAVISVHHKCFSQEVARYFRDARLGTSFEDSVNESRIRQCLAASLCHLSNKEHVMKVLDPLKEDLLCLFFEVTADADVLSHFPTEDFECLIHTDSGRFSVALPKAKKALRRLHDALNNHNDADSPDLYGERLARHSNMQCPAFGYFVSRHWTFALNLSKVFKKESHRSGINDSLHAILLESSYSQYENLPRWAGEALNQLIPGSLESEFMRRTIMMYRIFMIALKSSEYCSLVAAFCRSSLQNLCNISSGVKYHETHEKAGSSDTFSHLKSRILQRSYVVYSSSIIYFCLRLRSSKECHTRVWSESKELESVLTFAVHHVFLPSLSYQDVYLDALMRQSMQSFTNMSSDFRGRMPHVPFVVPYLPGSQTSLSFKTLTADIRKISWRNLRNIVLFASDSHGKECSSRDTTIVSKLLEISSFAAGNQIEQIEFVTDMMDHTTNCAFDVGRSFRTPNSTVSNSTSRLYGLLQNSIGNFTSEMEREGELLYLSPSILKQERSRIIRIYICTTLRLPNLSKVRQLAIFRLIAGIFADDSTRTPQKAQDITISATKALEEDEIIALNLRDDLCPLISALLSRVKSALIDENNWQQTLLKSLMWVSKYILLTPMYETKKVITNEKVPNETRSLISWALTPIAKDAELEILRMFVLGFAEFMHIIASILLNEQIWCDVFRPLLTKMKDDFWQQSDSGINDGCQEVLKLLKSHNKMKSMEDEIFPEIHAKLKTAAKNPYAKSSQLSDDEELPHSAYLIEKEAISNFHAAMQPFFCD